MPGACPYRQAAKAAGEKHYFTGKPCTHGHLSVRVTKDARCVECDNTKHLRRPEYEIERRKKRPYRPRKSRGKYSAENQRERFARWYAAHRDESTARNRKWRHDNPDKAAAKHHRRKARERNAEGCFSAGDIERIRSDQAGKCAHCRKSRKLTIDHKVALANGGTNWPSNIQLLCGPCNSAKRDLDPVVFAEMATRTVPQDGLST